MKENSKVNNYLEKIRQRNIKIDFYRLFVDETHGLLH